MLYPVAPADAGETPCILADLDEGILTLTLNRPAQRNAMNVALTLEIHALLEAVRDDESVRVVVLRGAGAGFCAGMDSPDFNDATRHDARRLHTAREAAHEWQDRLLRRLPQPVIASVHGFCEGRALAVLERCDIVLAADDTAFSMPAVDAGELLEGPEAKSMSRVMTPRAASYYALTGQVFDGREAERNGLVSQSVPASELQAQTDALAREFVAKDPLALRFTKETVQNVGDMSWDAALNFTAAKFAELKALQAGRPSPRAAAVAGFLSGKSKPGLGT